MLERLGWLLSIVGALLATAGCDAASVLPGGNDTEPPGGSVRPGADSDGGKDGTSWPSKLDGGQVRKPSSFALTSAESGFLPFTIGLGFGRGDIPAGFSLDLLDAQVDVKRRWIDGSVKHAIVSGFVTMKANEPSVVKITAGSDSGGNALSCADIAAANVDASVTLGKFGQVYLAPLLRSPVRTWLSGTQVVECHYVSGVGTDPTLRVRFHVRMYKGGRTRVRAIVENGFLDRTTVDKSYVPLVMIGTARAFDNGGSAISHYAHTRWVAEGWIGGDPKVIARHDTAYLIATRLVPNYWMNRPASGSALDSLTQTYSPMGRGDFTASMGETGYQAQIGILPNWDALFFTSSGDPRALRAVIANSLSLGSYGIVWRDGADELPARPSKRPNWSAGGEGQGGQNSVGAGPLTWEYAHHPSAGYLAYLLTGDYVHLETMQHQASTVYLVNSSASGPGVARSLQGQTRAVAWGARTIGQLAAIGPDDPVTEDYRALLASNVSKLRSVAATLGPSALGILYEYDLNLYAPATIAPWQQAFFVQTFGHLSDVEPLEEAAALDEVRNFLYRIPVGMLGAGRSDACFTRASRYTIKIGTGTLTGLSQAFTSWRDVDAASEGGASACGPTLGGDSGGAPSSAASGYWGNLMPSIAFAVDHAAPGADAAWKRLTSAKNWDAIAGSAWETAASWAIVPRGF